MIVMEYLDSRNVTLLNSVDDPWELSDIKVHLISDFHSALHLLMFRLYCVMWQRFIPHS